ncbi:MAG: PDZ domain-containing protein [Gaiellales bacterium]|nr:MAG: PDZ domain-containing protein [Gaiellales bacterium]
MKQKIINMTYSAVAGVAGAALFLLLAWSLGWGGLGGEPSAEPNPAMPPQLSSVDTGSETVAATGGALTPQQIYESYADSVVQIVSTFEGQSDFFHADLEQQGIGSGFITSTDGYILTNAHVVTIEGSGDRATKVEVNFRNGKTAEAEIVGLDLTSSDVAVIKVDPAGLELVPAVLGDSDAVRVGEPVVAIGSPFGLYSSSMTAGIVSATDRTVESPETGFVIQDAIQTDAAINRGNSGGPLFNLRGEVIGLNEQIISVSGGSEGVGFAVPINTARRVMGQIIEKGEVEYAWMGVIGQSVDADTAGELELTVDKGALINEVLADGPASKAGLESGDVIVKVGDRDIGSMEDVTGLLVEYRPGDKVKVTYVRGDETKETELELGKRPERL